MRSPGSRIGPYEVTGLLGTGGMGEVYRARDTRLDRDVALKILPASFASDPDRVMRFEREARTLASLNHPHIAQIFGIEDDPGEAGSCILVMELVEGEDLAARIAGGRVPLDEALPIARQIAEALEAAHEQGVVHRDLKPANIKLRANGSVKVLDFGLAKGGAFPDKVVNAPTMTSPAITMQGVILGTAAYMSPEQARGKSVDKRGDIWAFGCVLYELLTGRMTFTGATVTDTLSAITRDDPDWTALPPDTPPHVVDLLRRCLEKDPMQRLRDVGEARIALSRPLAPVAVPASSRSPRLGAVAAVLVAAATGALGYALGHRTPAATPTVASFTQLTDQPGFERQPAVSPDGRSVVYVSNVRGNADLYLLRVGGRNATLLTGDSNDDDYAPAFSRDGNRIAFRSERAGGGIFVMEATGESVRRVSDSGFDPHWSPDGNALVVGEEPIVDPMSRTSQSTLWVLNVADGTRRRVARPDAAGAKWSPTGRRLAYWGRHEDTGNRDLFTVASDGSEADNPVPLTADAWVDWAPAWSPDGQFLYFGSNRGGTMNLWRVPIDEDSGKARGAPEQLTTPSAWSGWFDVSADGRSIVFAELDERTTVWTAGFDPDRGEIVGRPHATLQGLAINSIDLSARGDRIVFTQRGQPWESLGVIRVDGSGWSRLTGDDAYHRVPVWSRDGTRVAFYTSTGIWTMSPDGSGMSQLKLPNELAGALYPVWSPDGGRLAVASDALSYGVVDMSASPPKLLAAEPRPPDAMGFLPLSWSPDGRRIAGTNRRTVNRDQVYVRDDLIGPPKMVARTGKSPAWLPDSRRLLYSSPTGLVLLDVETGREREVLPLPRTELQWGRLISLSQDGRTIAYLQSQNEGDIWLMTLNGRQ